MLGVAVLLTALAYALWWRPEATTRGVGSKPPERQPPKASVELTGHGEFHERTPASERIAASPAPVRDDPNRPKSEPEAWRQRRLTEAQKAYEDFLKVVERGEDSLQQMQHVLVLSIAPIMDEQGLAVVPRPDYEVTQPSGSKDNYFTFRGKRYQFARGMFPPYDRMMDLWAQQEKTMSAKPTPPGMPDPKRPALDVDELLLNEIELLKNQGLGAIERRREPY